MSRFYSMTQLSLEEITLQFIEQKARPALKKYLLLKLRNLSLKQKAQRTLLGTWLTEIYLDEVNAMGVGENMLYYWLDHHGRRRGSKTGHDFGIPKFLDRIQW